MELLHDTYTWVIFSFVVFAAVAWVFGRKALLSALDAKINTIREEVGNAARLKAEASALLTEYEQRQRDAAHEAEEMLTAARTQAEHVYHTEEQRLADMMARKEQQLVERITLLRDQAVADLRDVAARLAYQATENLVTSRMDDATRARLIERSLAQVSERLG